MGKKRKKQKKVSSFPVYVKAGESVSYYPHVEMFETNTLEAFNKRQLPLPASLFETMKATDLLAALFTEDDVIFYPLSDYQFSIFPSEYDC